jgi:OPT family oligopeptide transporter
MPISVVSTFDNTGSPYNISAVITNGVFDEQKYRQYSPIYLSTSFVLAYCSFFAVLSSVLVHTYCKCLIFLWYRAYYPSLLIVWYGRDIIRQSRRSLRDEPDVHSRLMRAYSDVPHWWYGMVFVGSFILAVISIEVYPTGFPFWALVFCIALALIFCLPLTIIYAITNQMVGLNVLSELLGGYVVPGRPIANMIFKVYGDNILQQAMRFTSDLKLGHYMKIPPRVMFMAQTVATIISCFVVVTVQRLLLDNVPGICTREQRSGFVCPSSTAFAQASIIWGGIGPIRLFGKDSTYVFLLASTHLSHFLTDSSQLRCCSVVLTHWRSLPHPILLARKEVSKLHFPIHKHADVLPWSCNDTTGLWDQPGVLGYGRIRLPILHTTIPTPLVDAL